MRPFTFRVIAESSELEWLEPHLQSSPDQNLSCSLFIRFVDTLGARDFVSPVTMLLAERAGKTLDQDALPVALLENFDVHIQLGVSLLPAVAS